MKNIAIIPARSGSKRLKDKNLQPILDLKLFLWTIRAAKSSNNIHKIIFSTDSKNYVDICRSDTFMQNYECEIDFRSKEEAGDKVKIYDYIRKDEFIKRNKISELDNLVLLLPTCPLRPKGLIDSVINLANESQSSVFTCCEYDFHVNFAFSIEDQKPFAFKPLFGINSPMISGNTRSQDQKKFYRPNGSVNFLPVKELLNPEAKSIYHNSLPFEMNRIYSCDIDNQIELKIANSTANSIKDELQYLLRDF